MSYRNPMSFIELTTVLLEIGPPRAADNLRSMHRVISLLICGMLS